MRFRVASRIFLLELLAVFALQQRGKLNQPGGRVDGRALDHGCCFGAAAQLIWSRVSDLQINP
jgi:hypothetical protein